MDYTRLIIAFGGLWLVQAMLAFVQSRTMTSTISELQRMHKGHLGVGVSRAKYNIGRGVILALVTNVEGNVSDFRTLSGISTFSRFKKQPKFIGLSLDSAAAKIKKDKKLQRAFNQAVDKINAERERNGYSRI